MSLTRSSPPANGFGIAFLILIVIGGGCAFMAIIGAVLR